MVDFFKVPKTVLNISVLGVTLRVEKFPQCAESSNRLRQKQPASIAAISAHGMSRKPGHVSSHASACYGGCSH